jgi:hypothetical protein
MKGTRNQTMKGWLAVLVLMVGACVSLVTSSRAWAQTVPDDIGQSPGIRDVNVSFEGWIEQENLRLEGQRLATFEQVSQQATDGSMTVAPWNDPRVELSTGAQVDASPGIAATSVGAGHLPSANTGAVFLPF